jgi:hypothetical protein
MNFTLSDEMIAYPNLPRVGDRVNLKRNGVAEKVEIIRRYLVDGELSLDPVPASRAQR